jgi:DNA-binding winged helix-turn-helix (wHTH) protein
MSEVTLRDKAKHYYEFDGYHFYPDERLLVRVRDSHPFKLMPKPNALLLVLVKHRGEIVTYDELKKEIWPDTVHVLTHTIRETKHALTKVLGESASRLETIAGKGYRFNVEAVVRQNGSESETSIDLNPAGDLVDAEKPQVIRPQEVKTGVASVERDLLDSQLSLSFAGHLWHTIMSCSLYALLYAIALLVEVAYQYDRFGAAALKIAPLVFLWTFGTSIVGLGVAWRREIREQSKGLILSLLIFAGAGIMLYLALGLFLPKSPVTEASFQTYTAHGAYLKSVCYFLFLAVMFLIIPFHFVLSLEKEAGAGRGDPVLNLLAGERRGVVPRGAIYLKVWWLGFLLLVIAVISPVLMAHLFDNLKPHLYMNFFMQLALWRLIIYLTLGMECLLWYYGALNKIRRSYQ